LPDPVVIIRYGSFDVPLPVVRFATLSPSASSPIRVAGLIKRFAWRLSLMEEFPGLDYDGRADTSSGVRAPSNSASSVRQVLFNQGQHLKRDPHFLRALNAKAHMLIEWKPLDKGIASAFHLLEHLNKFLVIVFGEIAPGYANAEMLQPPDQPLRCGALGDQCGDRSEGRIGITEEDNIRHLAISPIRPANLAEASRFI
jgi:hypothetical protein